MIPHSEWKWFGLAAHSFFGHQCRFHMATVIGNLLVSTIGERYVSDKKADLLYETMVFKVTGTFCKCGCGQPEFFPIEIVDSKHNDAKTATENHMETCRKVAAGEIVAPEKDENE